MNKLLNFAIHSTLNQMSGPAGYPNTNFMQGSYPGQPPYGSPYAYQQGNVAPYGSNAPYGQGMPMHTPPGGMGYPAAAPAGYPGAQFGSAAQPFGQNQQQQYQHYGQQQQYSQQQQYQQYGQQQYGQQQQQQQQHGGQQVVVLSPRYCLPQQTVLVMQEQFGMFSNDNFTITDATGRPFFMLAAAAFSIGHKRQLLDASNVPVCFMEKKMLSLRGSWIMSRADTGAKVAEIKPALASLTPAIKVYLNDGDKEPDFIIQGDFRGKRFTIAQRAPGRGDRQIASVQRESRFANSTAFLMSVMTDAQKYFLTIEPGVDVAFVTALATLCDEIYNDKDGA